MRTQRFLRSIVLAVGSIALVGVLFTLYTYSEGELKAKPSARPAETPVAVDPGGSPSPEMRIGKEQIPVGGGEHVRHVIYDKDGKVRGDVELARWQPVGDRRNEFEVTQPVIRFRGPTGQIVRITADAGRLITRSSDPRSFDPRSGRLQGNVVISLDRLTDAQREALPEEERDKLTPDRLVELKMGNLEFDMEFARVETTGPFEITSQEASVSGSGLTLDYNELEGRIEELNISERGRIELRGIDRTFALNPQDKEQAAMGNAKEPAATPAPTPTPTPSPAADDIPMLPTDEPARQHRPRPLDAYTAVFSGDVHITQFAKDAEVGRLLAQKLEILFDVGERERGRARHAPDAPGKEQPKDAEAEKEAKAAALENRVLVTWTGPLHVTSERLPIVADAKSGDGKAVPLSGRMHLTATGAPVSVVDSEREVACDKLIYHKETDFVQLFGTAEAPARVQAEGMGDLTGVFVELNRSGGTARATGPSGRLVAAKAAGFSEGGKNAPLDVRFEKSFDATFTRVEPPVAPAEGGKPAKKSSPKEILRTAVFVGDVVLDRAEDHIRCGKLDMQFDADANYRPHPVQALMHDDVRVSQDERFVAAKERLLAKFKIVERKKPPFDLLQARTRAVTEGRDPGKIDWAKVQANYEARRDFATTMQSMSATGGVEVRDPRQQLEIHSSTLDCTLAEDGSIESALVTPAADGQAFVAMGAFSIAAPIAIPFDAVKQTLRVNGSGRMVFPSKQSFDGRVLEDAVPVAVSWTERMQFDGAANFAEFVGAVIAKSPDSKYECGALRVEFRDAPKPAATVASAPAVADWWVLGPLAHRLGRREGDGEWRIGGQSKAFDKTPVRFFAQGGVKATNENFDPRDHKLRSRLFITGPAMNGDLEQNFVHVEGAGSLLIEDYRPSTHKPPQAVASGAAGPGAGPQNNVTTPFGEWVTSGSSQTYLAWGQSMHYKYRENVADFIANVTLVRSTGNKMKLTARGDLASADGKKAEGRESRLNCQRLHVEFDRPESEHPANSRAGAGRMSGTEVRSFTAQGQVYFFDSGISAIANAISYARSDNQLKIQGTDAAPAELYDQRNRFAAMRASYFVWDRATNRIWGPNTQARIN